jgi:hypothetical protein
MHRRRSVVVMACVLVLAGAGGCAKVDELRDKKPPRTKAAWVAEAEAICTTALAKMREQGLQDIQADAPGGDAGRLRGALRERRVGFLEVQELPPPDGLATEVQDFTQAAIDAVDELSARSRAKEQGDGVEERTTTDRAAARLAAARKAAAALGLQACSP